MAPMRKVLPLLLSFLVFGGCDCDDDSDVMDDVMVDGEVPDDDMGPTCVGRGGECAADTDCCEGPCTGGLCEMGCAALGIDCTAGADCCSGNCEGNVCAPAACIDIGGACVSSSNCCSGVCDATSGTCDNPPTCDATGALCSANCCSGICADEAGTTCSPGDSGCLCATPAECVAQGEACSVDAECCNNLCDKPGDGPGTCANPGSCLPAGEPCGTEGFNGSCCSTVCLDTGTGARCQFLGGCRVQDELCTSDAECCSGACNQAGTTADGRPITRCANVISCLPIGEVCGGSGGSSNCCPDGGGREGCFETGAGFSRCFGGDGTCIPPSMECTGDVDNCCTDAYPNIDCQAATDERADPTRVYCCLDDGEECAFGDVCCGGVCAPDPADGVLRCGATCIADGQACTTASDCCGCGCVDGVCTNDPALCDPCTGPQLGETCSADGPACCNAPAVVCNTASEFPTCILTP